MRFAYWIGMRRWPSWTKTTATTMPMAISGKNSFSTAPPLSQALMPCGMEVRIDAKISSEMPLPMPRFVISSPNHISTIVPAVSVTTISTRRPGLAGSAPWVWNRYAYPVACAAARNTVR